MRGQVSVASDPGGIRLSSAKLRNLHPELFSQSTDAALRTGWLELFADQLENGDSRAAVVVDADDGIVAAYADELDCVALLKFKPEIVKSHGWQSGTRLLTVNTYRPKTDGMASDLAVGPKQRGIFGNFRPLIADILTNDLARVEERKATISEDEWLRASSLGKQIHAAGNVKPRDGRPLRCDTPVKVENHASRPASSASGTAPRSSAKRPKRPAQSDWGTAGKASVWMIICFAATWFGVTHVLSMPHDFLFYVAWFGVAFFAMIGLRFGIIFYQALKGAR